MVGRAITQPALIAAVGIDRINLPLFFTFRVKDHRCAVRGPVRIIIRLTAQPRQQLLRAPIRIHHVDVASIWMLAPGMRGDFCAIRRPRRRGIVIAVESMVIGLVLIILVVQLAKLINLLQNEIKPILDSTNETVSTLRGTTEFLSNNLAEPVIKLNEYFAGLQSFLKIIRPANKDKKN